MGWTGVNRVRAITGAVAGTTMLIAVGILFAVDGLAYLGGWLPGAVPLLVAASVVVAAWRAEEAVAGRSPLRWAWGSAWRSWLVMVVGVGVIMSVLIGQARVSQPMPPPDPMLPGGYQVGVISAIFSGPAALLLGTVSHLAAAIAVRRAVRRWWRWFAT